MSVLVSCTTAKGTGTGKRLTLGTFRLFSACIGMWCMYFTHASRSRWSIIAHMPSLRCSPIAPASGPMRALSWAHIAIAVTLVCGGGTSGRKITCIRPNYWSRGCSAESYYPGTVHDVLYLYGRTILYMICLYLYGTDGIVLGSDLLDLALDWMICLPFFRHSFFV